MKKVLITGITGFVGSHLAEYYLKNGDEVYGTKKWRTDTTNIDHIGDRIKWKKCDIEDSHIVYNVVRSIEPDVIHHLAAMSFVPDSWDYPQKTAVVNTIGSINFLEAVKHFAKDCVIQVASSSEIYGIQKNLPITEENLPDPDSPYGATKLAMDRFASVYFKSFGVKTVITRGFNHTGPRRGREFASSSFARQIAEIEAKKKPPTIKVGNLGSKRDFTDVRDMVRAYALAVERCDYGTPYNIATERIVTIQYVLDTLLSYSDVKVKVEQDPERMRPFDLNILHGCAKKFRDKTGWKPEIPLEKTLEDLLNYWRERV